MARKRNEVAVKSIMIAILLSIVIRHYIGIGQNKPSQDPDRR
jgi:hypothetical protein